MDACLGVEREIDRVLERINGLKDRNSTSIDDLLASIKQVKQEIENVDSNDTMSPAQTVTLVQVLQQVKESAKKVGTGHRGVHSSVSKIGKAIDRNFVSDYDATSRDDIFNSQDQSALLSQVILQHFYRHGQLEIAEALAKEAQLSECLKDSKEPFQEINSILESLQRRDLGPALEWTERNRMELSVRGTVAPPSSFNNNNDPNNPIPAATSFLELKLHRQKFIDMLKEGKGYNRLEAIAYARQHFPRFINSNEREISALMGSLMYIGPRFEDSPYAHLLSDDNWKAIADLFVRDACALLGLSVDSALAVAVNAGCKALPALLNIKQVMLQHSGVWSAKDELPIEIDLGPNSRYHSIFACPILRQQTTDQNPPLKLTCGHCISRDALNKLAAGHKLKCPYCPVEQNPGDARQIYL